MKKYDFSFGSDLNCRENIESKSILKYFLTNKIDKAAAFSLMSRKNKMYWKGMQKMKKLPN